MYGMYRTPYSPQSQLGVAVRIERVCEYRHDVIQYLTHYRAALDHERVEEVAPERLLAPSSVLVLHR